MTSISILFIICLALIIGQTAQALTIINIIKRLDESDKSNLNLWFGQNKINRVLYDMFDLHTSKEKKDDGSNSSMQE